MVSEQKAAQAILKDCEGLGNGVEFDEQLSFCILEHNMKKTAFVVLGIVISCVVYALICFFVLEKLLHIGGCAGMAPAFLIIMPLSLLAGGMVTGLLSRPLLDTKWSLIWITPGLYLVILMLSISAIFMIMEAIASDVQSASSGILWMLPFSLYLYLASLAGVWLGYSLRGLIGRIRKSD